MQNVGRFNSRTPRSVESYTKEVNELRQKLDDNDALQALKANANWPVMEKIVRKLIDEATQRGRLANPLSDSGAFAIIYNNGMIAGLEAFINVPDQKKQDVETGGTQAKLEKTIADFRQDYPHNQ